MATHFSEVHVKDSSGNYINVANEIATTKAGVANKLGLVNSVQYDASILNSLPNLFNGVTWTPNYYFINPTTLVQSTSYKYSSLIPVKAGKIYTVIPRARHIAIYNGDTYSSTDQIAGSATFNPMVTPANDGYIRVTVYNADTDIKLVESDEKLGKVIYNFGDSIAAGAGNSNVGYGDLIAQKYGVLCVDYSQSGATLSKVNGQSMGCILDHIDGSSATLPDVILLEGASNDYSEARVTGTMSDKYDFAGTYDVTTFAGAMETAIYKLMTKYPGVPIIWVYSHQQDSRHSKTVGEVTVDYGDMHDLSLTICKKWGVPVADMFEAGGMNTNFAYHKTNYTGSGDGTHPNADGYNKYYVPKISAKISDVIVL